MLPDTTAEQIGLALQGQSLVHLLRRPGKSFGDGVEPEPEVVEILKRRVAAMRLDGTKFKVETVVNGLPWERDAYYERVKRYRHQQQDLERWYYESPTKGQSHSA